LHCIATHLTRSVSRSALQTRSAAVDKEISCACIASMRWPQARGAQPMPPWQSGFLAPFASPTTSSADGPAIGTKFPEAAWSLKGIAALKILRLALAMVIVLPCASFAQGGGGGSGGGSAGGGAGGAASSAAGGGGTSSSPSGTGNAASGAANSAGTTSGLTGSPTGTAAAPGTAPSTNQGTGERNGSSMGAQAPGTNAAGTATSSGSSGASAQSTPAGGIGRPTTTNTQDSDAKIDQENNKADRTVGKICKNC